MLSSHAHEVAIADIREVSVEQGFMARQFGIGDVRFGLASGQTVFWGIEEIQRVCELIKMVQADEAQKQRVPNRS